MKKSIWSLEKSWKIVSEKGYEPCDKLKMLKRMKFLQVKQLEDIYYKMILPNIMYSISVWVSCSLAFIEDIDKLHNKAARPIHDILTNLLCWSPGSKSH